MNGPAPSPNRSMGGPSAQRKSSPSSQTSIVSSSSAVASNGPAGAAASGTVGGSQKKSGSDTLLPQHLRPPFAVAAHVAHDSSRRSKVVEASTGPPSMVVTVTV